MIVVDIMKLILDYNTRTQSQWTSRALLSLPSNRSFPSTTVCWKTSRSGLLLKKKINMISLHFFFQHRPMVGSSETTKNCQSLSGSQNCATISTQKFPCQLFILYNTEIENIQDLCSSVPRQFSFTYVRNNAQFLCFHLIFAIINLGLFARWTVVEKYLLWNDIKTKKSN